MSTDDEKINDDKYTIDEIEDRNLAEKSNICISNDIKIDTSVVLEITEEQNVAKISGEDIDSKIDLVVSNKLDKDNDKSVHKERPYQLNLMEGQINLKDSIKVITSPPDNEIKKNISMDEVKDNISKDVEKSPQDASEVTRLEIEENNGKLSRSDTGNTCILIMDREKSDSVLATKTDGGAKSLLSTPTEEPRNKSPVTIQEWVDSLPLEEQAARREEETSDEVESNDWEVENLTLGAEAAIVCPPEPCPSVQITGCLGGSDAGSHCSSMESFLEARKPDPEELLLELGFGGPPTQNDNISRIPARFLQPSNLKGIDIEHFLQQQQEMADTLQSSFNGYRGLTGRQHERPSIIVGKIMERLREAEHGGSRARRGNMAQGGHHSATDASPKLATVARNLLNRLRVVRAEGSVLSPDNRAWFEAQGDRSPEPKNKKLIIGKQSFTFTNDGNDLIPCKSRSPSRSPNSNHLSPRNVGSEEHLSLSPKRLSPSPKRLSPLSKSPSPNRLSPRDASSRSDEHLSNKSPNRLSPHDMSRSDDYLTISPKYLSPRNSVRSESPNNLLSHKDNNFNDNLNTSQNHLSPKAESNISTSLDLFSKVNKNIILNRLSSQNNKSDNNNFDDRLSNVCSVTSTSDSDVSNDHENLITNKNTPSKSIEIPKTIVTNHDMSHHFASLCNVHKPIPRRRSGGNTVEPTSSMVRKTSEPFVKSCGCLCHSVSPLSPVTVSPSESISSSVENFGLSFGNKLDVDPAETEYKVLSELAAELTPSELMLDLISEEDYTSFSEEERHGLLVRVLENALCAYEERLDALELGTGLTRVLYSHLDRVSRLLNSSDANLLAGIAQQVTSLLQHQASLKQELDIQEKLPEATLS